MPKCTYVLMGHRCSCNGSNPSHRIKPKTMQEAGEHFRAALRIFGLAVRAAAENAAGNVIARLGGQR